VDAFRPSFAPPVGVEFRRDDAHVIAFLGGHPEYEAVEVFATRSPGAPALLRAILTRHDQTQVDHVSDPVLVGVQRASVPSRSIVSTDVQYAETTQDGRTHVRLAFTSFRGERVVLELAATPATQAFGGLTDPEGHAPDVLPIMWRDASAIAGAGTRCLIDDVPCELAPFGDGVKAFHTVGFAVGLVVSREIALRVIESPRALVAGAHWRFRRHDEELVYEVVDAGPARVVIRGTSRAGETIDAVVLDGRLAPTAVTFPSASARGGELVVRFAPFLRDGARFAVDVDAHRDLLTGDIAGTAANFYALFDAPSWARSRTVRVRLRRTGDEVAIATAVGSYCVDAAGPTC
jgi:hypothetical protein